MIYHNEQNSLLQKMTLNQSVVSAKGEKRREMSCCKDTSMHGITKKMQKSRWWRNIWGIIMLLQSWGASRTTNGKGWYLNKQSLLYSADLPGSLPTPGHPISQPVCLTAGTTRIFNVHVPCHHRQPRLTLSHCSKYYHVTCKYCSNTSVIDSHVSGTRPLGRILYKYCKLK